MPHAVGMAAALVGLVSVIVQPAASIFAEQAGVIDWRQQYVGKPFASTFASNGKVVVVATEADVVAGINARTGDILWRQVLPPANRIDKMLSLRDSVVTLSAGGATVRKWDATRGTLKWEASVYPKPIVPPTSNQMAVRAVSRPDGWTAGVDAELIDSDVLVLATGIVKKFSESGSELWSVALDTEDNSTFHTVSATKDKFLVVGVTIRESATYKVETRSLSTGAVTKTESFQFPFKYSESTRCRVVGAAVLACINEEKLHILSLVEDKTSAVDLGAKDATFGHSNLQSGAIVVSTSAGSKAFRLVDTDLKPIESLSKAKAIGILEFEESTIFIGVSAKDSTVSFIDSASGDPLTLAESTSVDFQKNSVSIDMCFGYLYRRSSDKGIGSVVMLLNNDGSLIGVRKGEAIWTREESLASVSGAVFSDLPPSATLALDQNLQKAVLANPELQRDYFNKKKIAILATKAGKLHGVMSSTGTALWSVFADKLEGTVVSTRVFSIRPVTHVDPLLLFVVETTEGWFALEVNPITGTLYKSSSLDYSVKLITETPVHDETGAAILTLLDSNDVLHVYPDSAAAAAAIVAYTKPIFLYTIDEVNGALRGYKVATAGTDSVMAKEMWAVNFDPEIETIAAVATKHPKAKVNSVGETLGDRNVIYKYLNPNILALATTTPYNRGSTNMTIYLIDTVKGSTLAKVYQTGVFGAVHLTQSANWIVYHYRSRRSKRNEIGILELFSPSDDPPESGFSSYDPVSPIVLQQAYITPFTLSALSTTITEQGVTEPFILAAQTSGSILGIQKRLVDSRRPTNSKAAKHAEGVPPYHPVIGLPHQANLNHELTLAGIENIFSSPCGLESTTTVLATGLDVYLTQIEPSKKFDALSDDFPHTLLVAALVGLSTVVFFFQSRGQERKLKKLWK